MQVLKDVLGILDTGDMDSYSVDFEDHSDLHIKKSWTELQKLMGKQRVWDERAAFVDAVVSWNKYRFQRDMMEHTVCSISKLTKLRKDAVKDIVQHIPQTSGFQSVVKLSLFFQYEHELLAIGRVLQFDTGVMESGNKGLRALYHIIQSQGGSSGALHRLHTRITTLDSKCRPEMTPRRKLEALSHARETGGFSLGPSRTGRIAIDGPALYRPVLPAAVARKYGSARNDAYQIATDPYLKLFPEVYRALCKAQVYSMERVQFFQRHDVLAFPDADSTQDPGRELPGKLSVY